MSPPLLSPVFQSRPFFPDPDTISRCLCSPRAAQPQPQHQLPFPSSPSIRVRGNTRVRYQPTSKQAERPQVCLSFMRSRSECRNAGAKLTVTGSIGAAWLAGWLAGWLSISPADDHDHPSRREDSRAPTVQWACPHTIVLSAPRVQSSPVSLLHPQRKTETLLSSIITSCFSCAVEQEADIYLPLLLTWRRFPRSASLILRIQQSHF